MDDNVYYLLLILFMFVFWAFCYWLASREPKRKAEVVKPEPNPFGGATDTQLGAAYDLVLSDYNDKIKGGYFALADRAKREMVQISAEMEHRNLAVNARIDALEGN